MSEDHREILRIALDQSERLIDAQMLDRLTILHRAARCCGFCITLALIMTFGGLYELDHASRQWVVIGAVVVIIMLISAASFAFVTIRERVTLPGRLPSDIWASLLNSKTTDAIFIKTLLNENQRRIECSDKLAHTSRIILRCSYGLAVIAAILIAGLGIFVV